jgi:putative oxidoreductase
MLKTLTLYDRATGWITAQDWLLPTLARFLFAAVLTQYFFTSGVTKLDGLFTLSTGAYVQIFPRAFEAAGYDATALSAWHGLVAYAGTLAEFVLPALIVLGLFTRFAALGMIGFDRLPDGTILDQRGLWVLLLVVLVVKGGGPVALDRVLLARRR